MIEFACMYPARPIAASCRSLASAISSSRNFATNIGTQCSMFGFPRSTHEDGAGWSHATMCSGRCGTLFRPMSGMSWGVGTGRPLGWRWAMGGALIGGGGGTLPGPYGGPPRRGAGCGRAANVGDAATGGAMAERCLAGGPASGGVMTDRRVRMVTVASEG